MLIDPSTTSPMMWGWLNMKLDRCLVLETAGKDRLMDAAGINNWGH
jgi:hypothetical protein